MQQLETAKILQTLSQHPRDDYLPSVHTHQERSDSPIVRRKRKAPSVGPVIHTVSPSPPSASEKEKVPSHLASENCITLPPLKGLGNISTIRVNPLRPPPKLRKVPVKAPISLPPIGTDNLSTSKQFTGESSVRINDAPLNHHNFLSRLDATSMPFHSSSVPLPSNSSKTTPLPNTVNDIQAAMNIVRAYSEAASLDLKMAQHLMSFNNAHPLSNLLASQVMNQRQFAPRDLFCQPVGANPSMAQASLINPTYPSSLYVNIPQATETLIAPAIKTPMCIQVTHQVSNSSRINPQHQQQLTSLPTHPAPSPKKKYKRCRMENCDHEAIRRSPYCSKHAGPRKCEKDGCNKCAQGRTRFCIAHGGGRRCQHEGCTKGARGRYFCAFHGGGRRCSIENCNKLAVGKGTTCTAHGGGRRCQHEGCAKSAQSSSNFCVRHGGGKKCRLSNCTRVARGKLGLCMAHESQFDRQLR